MSLYDEETITFPDAVGVLAAYFNGLDTRLAEQFGDDAPRIGERAAHLAESILRDAIPPVTCTTCGKSGDPVEVRRVSLKSGGKTDERYCLKCLVALAKATS